MAVTTTNTPIVQPLQSFDLRLPIAKWMGYALVTGDASGGDMTSVIQWTPTNASELFSVEEASVLATAPAADSQVDYTLVTRERISSAESLRVQKGALLPSGFSRPRQEPKFSDIIFTPRTSTGAWFVQAAKPNVNLATLEFWTWGYIWDPQALLMIGGPIRPGQYLIPSGG